MTEGRREGGEGGRFSTSAAAGRGRIFFEGGWKDGTDLGWLVNPWASSDNLYSIFASQEENSKYLSWHVKPSVVMDGYQ
jgi:hypothetical protein